MLSLIPYMYKKIYLYFSFIVDGQTFNFGPKKNHENRILKFYDRIQNDITCLKSSKNIFYGDIHRGDIDRFPWRHRHRPFIPYWIYFRFGFHSQVILPILYEIFSCSHDAGFTFIFCSHDYAPLCTPYRPSTMSIVKTIAT